MKLPLKYNLQSMGQRKLRSLLTILGVGLSIFLAVMMIGLSRGLVATNLNSGNPLNVIVLSKGADSMEFSALDPEALHLLGSMSGIAPSQMEALAGQALASPEVYITSLVRPESAPAGTESLGLIHGAYPIAYELHENIRVIEGKLPERGFQVMVGKLAATKLGLPEDALPVGSQIHFEGQAWDVVGRFEAPGTVFESEIWTNLDDLMTTSKREDYSAIVIRGTDPKALEDIKFELDTRTDVRTTSFLERDYYAAIGERLKPVQVVSWVMTCILVLGGLMAGMNTMFNSIAGRVREMMVLLVVGYKRRSVLLSFMLESVLLCLIGGLLGGAAGLLLNGLPMRVPMGAFRFIIDPLTMGIGLSLALLIGLLGALVPVVSVQRISIVDGLKGR
ncbi:ABC transporter permease [bacterium]|nr:ABC transporter permease [bacterium]